MTTASTSQQFSNDDIIQSVDDALFSDFNDGLYIGMMSGTSLDALDTVICRFSNDASELIATHSEPFPAGLRAVLMALCQPNGVNDLSQEVIASLGFTGEHTDELTNDQPQSELDWAGWAKVAYAEFASSVIQTLLQQANISEDDIVAIGSHGQTVRHRPHYPKQGFTWQLGDANVLAERTGISVVSDFRQRDMAVGGQGAPLAPAFHVAQFASRTVNRMVLNLGGIANITVLPAGNADTALDNVVNSIVFDTGPASNFLDAHYQHHVSQGNVPSDLVQTKLYDTDGNWAKTGQMNTALLTQLLTHPYFALPAPKSTGREDFHLSWLNEQIEAVDVSDAKLSPADVQATLTQLTVQTVAMAIMQQAKRLDLASSKVSNEVIVCGGGAYNSHLLSQLADALPDWHIKTSQDFGVAPTWIEAMAFAWLAKQTLMGEAGNLPAVTGASKAVVLGQVCFA